MLSILKSDKGGGGESREGEFIVLKRVIGWETLGQNMEQMRVTG